jgi:hypothetical protein
MSNMINEGDIVYCAVSEHKSLWFVIQGRALGSEKNGYVGVCRSDNEQNVVFLNEQDAVAHIHDIERRQHAAKWW